MIFCTQLASHCAINNLKSKKHYAAQLIISGFSMLTVTTINVCGEEF